MITKFKAGAEIARTYEGKVKRVYETSMFGSECGDEVILVAVVSNNGEELKILLNNWTDAPDEWAEVTIDFPGAVGFGEHFTTKGLNE